jgi:hypothetical protein
MKLRSPEGLIAIGVAATLLLVLTVVLVLAWFVGQGAVSDNAALIAALVPLGGVFTAQMVSIALEDQRAREARELETQRAHEAALQSYFEQVGELLMEKPLHQSSPGDSLSIIVRALTLTVLELPPIGWQLFILGSSQNDSTAFPSFLDTYATRLLPEALRGAGF